MPFDLLAANAAPALSLTPATLATFLLGIITLLLGMVVWFLQREIKSNDEAHKQLKTGIDETRRELKTDIRAIETDVKQLLAGQSRIEGLLQASWAIMGAIRLLDRPAGRIQMGHRRFGLPVLVTIIAALGLQPAPAAGQERAAGTDDASAWTMPRLPDGQPDLQGFWTTQTFTPLERPQHLGDKAFYSEEEWASLQAQLTAEGVDPLAGNVINIEDPEEREQRLYQDNRDPSYVHYDNELWLRTPVPKGLSTLRTSLITDPPNGRIPATVPEAEARAQARAEARRGVDPFTGHETRPLSERCIVWPHNGPPMLPPAYNDIHQILQTPDHIVIFTELNNSLPRIIPLDGRPALPEAIQLIPGDSRGRWDGDTLVVESANFTDKTRFRGSSAALRVTERFTRTGADSIRYEFTVDDPTTWARPWSAEIPMVTTEGPMYEYACHEGNHDIRHILEIYRNLERQAAAAEKEAEAGR